MEQESKAYFAGGCFWGIEIPFEQKDDIISATSGYISIYYNYKFIM